MGAWFRGSRQTWNGFMRYFLSAACVSPRLMMLAAGHYHAIITGPCYL